MQQELMIKAHIVWKDGEARIAGKEHLKAELVARMHVKGEAAIEEVMEQYGLTRAEVHAALTYYFDNQDALDEAYERSWSESKGIQSAAFRAMLDARKSNKNL